MNEKIKEQIIAVRDSGRVNMFNTNGVQMLADEYGFHELVIFIEEHRDKYWHFILTGKTES